VRWLRSRPWPVWAAAGSVFVLFAVLGAVTRTPTTSAVRGPGLAAGLERGEGGATATPGPPAPTGNRYPGVSYPTRLPAPTGTVTPTPSATAPYFADCAAAQAAGAAPIARGRPGYRPVLDRDGDGVACDKPVATPTAGPTATATPIPGPTPDPTVDPTPTPTVTPSPTVAPTTEPPVVEPVTG
jgi:excalibur calcium-binding domain-containing protein